MASGGGGTLPVEQIFQLLDSADTVDDIRSIILDNLSSSKETWLIHLLVDHYFQTRSPNVQEIFAEIKESQAKVLLEKIQDGLKSAETRQPALQLVLYLAYQEIPWCHQIVDTPLFASILKIMKTETDVPVLMTSLMVVVILLPSLPVSIGPHLPVVFEIFGRVSILCAKCPVTTPEVFVLYLQVALYSLFHRLYGMYPCSFMSFIRKFYGLKENIHVYEEIVLPMIERVRLHPKLIMGQKETETSKNIWKNHETQDIVVACSRLSLDYIEGSWEDTHCPVFNSLQAVDRFKQLTQAWERQRQLQQQQQVPTRTVSIPQQRHPDGTICEAGSKCAILNPSNAVDFSAVVGESPSLLLGLSTPPGSQRATPASSFLEPGPTQVSEGGTGDNTSGQITPSQPDDGEKTPISRSSSRGAFQASKSTSDPKRPTVRPAVTPGTPSTASQTLPWMSPAVGGVGTGEASPFKSKSSAFEQPKTTAMRSLSFNPGGTEEGERAVPAITLQPSTESEDIIQEPQTSDVEPVARMVKAQMSATEPTLAESKSTSVDAAMSTVRETKPSDSTSAPADNMAGKAGSEGRDSGQEVSGSQVESSLAVLTEVLDKLSTPDTDTVDQEVEEINEREDQFDESAALTSSSSSTLTTSQTEITAESVRQFMKKVNRIRFNSLTSNSSSNSEADNNTSTYHLAVGASSSNSHTAHYRPRSCPPFKRTGPPMPGQETSPTSPPRRAHNRRGGNFFSGNAGRGSAHVAKKQTSTERSSVPSGSGQQHSKRPGFMSQRSVPGAADYSEGLSDEVALSEDSSDDFNSSVSPGDTPEKACPAGFRDQIETTAISAAPTAPDVEVVPGLPEKVNAVFQCILAPSKLAVCSDCHQQLVVTSGLSSGTSRTLTGKEISLFSTITPPELLDRHLRLGSDLHTKELTKIPLTSKETTNWTHFGGLPPADEVSILRGQILLMQTQILYERHKRVNHAKRNRRLLRRMTHIVSLEEQQRSLVSQVRHYEEEVQHLSVSVRLLQEENRKLRQIHESDEYEKLVEFRASLIENKDLKAASIVLKNLLLSQREEHDKQQKKLERVQHQNMENERELRICKERLALTDKLKQQVLQLQNEVLLTQEFHQKCQEKLHQGATLSRHQAEESYLTKALKAEIQELREENKKCSNRQDAYQARLQELEKQLKDKDDIINDIKKSFDAAKSSHSAQLQAVEERCRGLVHTNQHLEGQVMDLTGQLDQALHKKMAAARRAIGLSTATTTSMGGGSGSAAGKSSSAVVTDKDNSGSASPTVGDRSSGLSSDRSSLTFEEMGGRKSVGSGRVGLDGRQGSEESDTGGMEADGKKGGGSGGDKGQGLPGSVEVVVLGSLGTLGDSGVVESERSSASLPAEGGSGGASAEVSLNTGDSVNTGDSAWSQG